jgi:hypothetical protein
VSYRVVRRSTKAIREIVADVDDKIAFLEALAHAREVDGATTGTLRESVEWLMCLRNRLDDLVRERPLKGPVKPDLVETLSNPLDTH